MRTIALLVALPFGILATGGSPHAWAQSNDGEKAPQQETGSEIFARHCAPCHGAEARGKGPVSPALNTPPADLTRIAARHEGVFPSAKVADVIRTGGGVLGHGTLEMPAWGVFFSEKANPTVGRTRISELVRYIESLQEK